MDLEQIWAGRLRVLQTRTTSLEGRVTALEDLSTKSLQRSDDRWSQIKRLAEMTGLAGRIIGLLARHWGVITLGATATWAGLRWLFRTLLMG